MLRTIILSFLNCLFVWLLLYLFFLNKIIVGRIFFILDKSEHMCLILSSVIFKSFWCWYIQFVSLFGVLDLEGWYVVKRVILLVSSLISHFVIRFVTINSKVLNFCWGRDQWDSFLVDGWLCNNLCLMVGSFIFLLSNRLYSCGLCNWVGWQSECGLSCYRLILENMDLLA
jgi:hypothetical protein